MIPTSYLQEWSAQAPWPDLQQVEQDLIICRALCDLFNAHTLAGKIAFRGGTAINKLLFRYSSIHGPVSEAIQPAILQISEILQNFLLTV